MARRTERIKSIFPRMAVGVMGSSGGIIPSEVAKRVYKLGKEIGRRRHVLITGACPGLPHEAVKGAKSEVGVPWLGSPRPLTSRSMWSSLSLLCGAMMHSSTQGVV